MTTEDLMSQTAREFVSRLINELWTWEFDHTHNHEEVIKVQERRDARLALADKLFSTTDRNDFVTKWMHHLTAIHRQMEEPDKPFVVLAEYKILEFFTDDVDRLLDTHLRNQNADHV